MRLSVEHCFYVPSKMASPEALQELLVQATLFPDTEIPRHSIEEIIEITKEKKHGNVDRIKLALQINGIYLEIPYWIGQSNLRNPADFQVLFIRYVWDGLHKNYPGEDKRLQDVLFWVFKYTDALYMESWGQNDEFSQDVPDEYEMESLYPFPSSYYLLSKELVDIIGEDRLAGLGPVGHLNGSGLWLKFRDNYYFLIDKHLNEKKAALFKEMWEGWKIKHRALLP